MRLRDFGQIVLTLFGIILIYPLLIFLNFLMPEPEEDIEVKSVRSLDPSELKGGS